MAKVFIREMHDLLNSRFAFLYHHAKDISKNARVYPDEYEQKFLDYSEALKDVLQTMVSDKAAKDFEIIINRTSEDLLHEIADFQKNYDVRCAREHQEALSSRYNGLAELLQVINDDDLLKLESKSSWAESTLIDYIEDFYDSINEFRKKYKLKKV